MTANTQIMIVEDEVIVAKNIEKRLKSLGYQVPVVTSTGEDALEKATAADIDLTLMDIRLAGEMDGITTAAALKSRFGIPVIYLTAYTDEPTLQRAKLTQPLGYIRKPFELIDLKIAIEMAVHKHQAERQSKADELGRELLIAELQEVVNMALSGLLTICASCKRVKDEEGEWQPIEIYIRDHSEADFSHGLCSDCGKKLYPDFFKE